MEYGPKCNKGPIPSSVLISKSCSWNLAALSLLKVGQMAQKEKSTGNGGCNYSALLVPDYKASNRNCIYHKILADHAKKIVV